MAVSGGTPLGKGEQENLLSSTLQSLLCENEKQHAKVALETLLMFANNVSQHPEEEKYRKIRIENKGFNSKVWRFTAAQTFMMDWGWVEVDGFLHLTSDKNIQLVKQVLQKQLSLFPTPKVVTEPKTEKEKVMEEERKKIREEQKKQAEEKKRILAQIKSDREDLKTRQVRASKAQHLQSPGKMTKFEDIGVDLNAIINQVKGLYGRISEQGCDSKDEMQQGWWMRLVEAVFVQRLKWETEKHCH